MSEKGKDGSFSIRNFDKKDRQHVRKTLTCQAVRRWMEGVSDISETNRVAVNQWMDETGGHRFARAVTFSTKGKFGPKDSFGGFVFAYGVNREVDEGKNLAQQVEIDALYRQEFLSSNEKRRIEYLEEAIGEREEIQNRVARLVEAKMLPESVLQSSFFEVSYAKHPGSKSGLIAPALASLCEEINETFTGEKPVFFAFVEQDNERSIEVLKKAGFELIGQMKYDEDSEKKDLVFAKIDWAAHSFKSIMGKKGRR